jgi:hypothetical protein
MNAVHASQNSSFKMHIIPSSYGCLESSLFSSGLQSTFQKVYGNHNITLSRKHLNLGYYLDEPMNNIYIKN